MTPGFSSELVFNKNLVKFVDTEIVMHVVDPPRVFAVATHLTKKSGDLRD